MSRPVILFTQPIHFSSMARLAEAAELRMASDRSERALMAAIGEASALVVRDPITPAVIEAGRELRIVARHGVGLDYIPVELCSRLRIPVTITPDANATSVAEWTIGAMLALSHQFGIAMRRTREGEWKKRDGLTGFELRGRTLGIVGLGRIGRQVARIASAGLQMRVLATRPRQAAPTDIPGQIDFVPLEQLLGASDIISLHLPYVPETHHIIGRERLALMRPGAILINSARGGLVDTAALAAAIAEKRLSGAALDGVAEGVLPDDHPLLHQDNVIVTPHAAALTQEAMQRMGDAVADDILRVLAGKKPTNQVNSF